ncbi:MAG TPA: hypothetical protein VK525_22605 [Candidatus Saccharimonadales bacterium]|nr:hypothetical protein [Candidatus Saccharimonadales bacterium]
MQTNLRAALLLGLVVSASPASAQQRTSLELNKPYYCSNGLTVTVTRCVLQAGKEYCEFKVEQNGKFSFQAAQPGEQLAAGVKSCPTKAPLGAAPTAAMAVAKPSLRAGQFNPPYLAEMPTAERVMEAMKTSDARETATRQMAAFEELMDVIKELSGPREFRGWLPDEMKILTEYSTAKYNLSLATDKAYPGPYKTGQTFSDYTPYHYSRFDPRFGYKDIFVWQFFSEGVHSQFALLVGKDNSNYAAKIAEQKRASEEALKPSSPGAPVGGSPFVRNDPGTLAARRCVELGGSALECVGKGLWGGLLDMAGVSPNTLGGPTSSGLVMNGVYTNGSGLSINFGEKSVSVTGCGKLVPNGHAYAITKKASQLVLNVASAPAPLIISMGGDGKLAGPGPIDIAGQIITGYHDVWMQEYRNGVEQVGGSCPGRCGYWVHDPIYAPKTERCVIGVFTQAPPGAPAKSELINALTASIDSVMHTGPAGLRMTGRYSNPGGLVLEFEADAVTIDCGAAHVKQPYIVENAATQILIAVKNGAAPFSLALQPNGTLVGSGNADIVGRVVTGATGEALTYATKNARCAIGTLTAKSGN